MVTVNKVAAGEPQVAGMPAWFRPRTEQLTKAAEAMSKGDVLVYDKVAKNYKKCGAGDSGKGAIVCQPAAIGDATVEAYKIPFYIYTVIASEALDPWGYVKMGANAQVAKWVSGADTAEDIFGEYCQRPNASPPQPSGANPLLANDVGEVVGILMYQGGIY